MIGVVESSVLPTVKVMVGNGLTIEFELNLHRLRTLNMYHMYT